MKQATSFVRSLHGLRGIAVLYVFLSHIGIGGFYLIPFVHYERIGKIGVIIFFGLSAFLLTDRLKSVLEANENKSRAIGAYFIHRLFRIYPLFILVLIIHVLMGHFGWYDMLQHLLLRQGYFELWAIPVEFKYYFCIPLIALLAVLWGMRKTVAALLMGLTCAVIYGCFRPNTQLSDGIYLYQKLEPFLVGSALALMLRLKKTQGEGIRRFSSGKFIGASAIILMTIGTYLFQARKPDHLQPLWDPLILLIIATGTAGMIVTALQDNLLSRLLGNSLLVFFGEISFSLYLLHGFVLGWFWQHARDWHYAGAWLITLTAVALSWISYSLVERPGIRLGYRIGKLIEQYPVKEKSRA